MKSQRLLASLIAGAGAALIASQVARRRRAIDFAGKVVVITGGSRGLGLVLARQFAQEGARLCILGQTDSTLERALMELASRGADVQAIVCDIRDREAVHAAVDTIVERFGGIDVLINNAGVIQVGPVRHMTYEDFEQAMGVHYWGPLHMTMAALPHLRRGARIVNIASIGGKYPIPHLVPYCASKFALVGLSESLRAELLQDGIHVTTVSPGLMRTGSPPNVTVKGDHENEYGWFVLLDSLPLVSIGAERAARKIVDAARHGDPSLTITPQAKLVAALEGIAPGCVARINALANAVLPKPAGVEGDRARTGFESRPAWLPDVVVRLTDRAGVRNNEI